MTLPKAPTSRFFLFWVALAALALLATPVFAQTPQASPSSVAFSYVQRSQCNPCSQPVNITDASGNPLTISSVVIAQPTSANSPAAVSIFVYQVLGKGLVYIGLDQGIPLYNLSYNPGGLYPPGTYSGTATVTVSGGGQVVIPLAITVNQSLNFSVSPTALTFQVPVGGFTTGQTISVTTSGVATSFTAIASTTNGGSWLSLTATTYTTPASITVSVNAAGLSSGTYQGNIAITPTSGTATNVPVTMQVGTGVTSMTATPSSFAFSAASSSTPSQSSSLFIQNTSGATTYFASIINSNCGSCITLNGYVSAGGSFIGGSVTLTVVANPVSLVNGTYSATIRVQGSDLSSVDVPVTFTVGTGSSGGLSISPASIIFSAPNLNISPGAQSVALSSTAAGVTYSVTASSANNWLLVNGSYSTSGSLPASFTVSASTFGLPAGTYSGSLFITTQGGLSTSQTIPVTLTVGTSAGGGATVAPTSLTFVGQAASARNPNPQYIAVSGSGLLYTATGTTTTGGSWLSVDSGGGSTPGTVTVSVTTGSLGAGSYSGNVTITVGGISTVVPVTLTLNAVGTPIANPGGILYNFNGSSPVSQFLTLQMSDNSSAAYTIANGAPGWIQLSQTSGTIPAGGSSTVGFTLNPASLPSGATSSTLTISANGQTVSVPVVANVLYGGGGGGGTGPLTISPASVAFTLQNTSSAQSQSVTLGAITSTYFVANATTSTGAAWLSVNPTSGTAPSTLIISVNPAGLTPGTYSGTVTLTASGQTQSIPVSMTVTAQTTAVSFAPTSLTFSYSVGGSVPATQSVQVASQSGSSVTFTTSASTSSGGNWLSVTPGTGATTSNIQVSILTAALTTAGTYNGTITVNPVGGAAQTIPVSITVTAPPTVTASPTALTFTYRAGDAAPGAQAISVTASGSTTPLTFTATATAQSGGNWLSVTPVSGQTPATLNVNITPGALDAGTYNGSITVVGTGNAQGSTTVTVTLTVTAPLPTISRVVSEASGLSGGLAPGEIIRIVGTAIGPATPAYGSLDSSTGRWQTTVGGAQVLINGLPAPVIAASAGQVSAVVPYEVAGRLDSFVQIRIRGNTSNALTLPVTTTVPGIFTQNFSGTGPGAILNDNGSVNGPGNPIAKGGIVVIYATGEGLARNSSGASPSTGAIVNVVSIADLPRPRLPVAVQIDGQPCNVLYAGSAPGQIAGLFQVNVQVPPNVGSGNVPVVIAVGSNTSQTGVTVSVR